MGKDYSKDNIKEKKDKDKQDYAKKTQQRYIFITGGVLSSLGKAAS